MGGFVRIGLLAVFLLAPAAAQAHLVSTRFGDFYGGAMHPLTAMEHALPWLAIGILAGMQGPRTGRWILLAFPLGLFVGAALAWFVPTEPIVSQANIASFAVVGLLVAAAWPLPAPVLIAAGLVFGLTHGYENGTAMTPATNHLLFILGVTTVGWVFIALTTALTTAFLQSNVGWRRIGVRAVGSWIAAVGIMLIGFRFVAR
ncbi:MAG: HupE/UreJ family protein [Rhodospirillales bacterium]|nr:HupE/UreJ family protein [Rhodospirillales bacterium]